MIYLILIILLLTAILYFIYKDYLKVLRVSSIITGVAGFLTLIIGYAIRYIVNSNVNFMNISKITNLILARFLRNSIYLFALSLIELIIYVLINYYVIKKRRIATT